MIQRIIDMLSNVTTGLSKGIITIIVFISGVLFKIVKNLFNFSVPIVQRILSWVVTIIIVYLLAEMFVL